MLSLELQSAIISCVFLTLVLGAEADYDQQIKLIGSAKFQALGAFFFSGQRSTDGIRLEAWRIPPTTYYSNIALTVRAC